jgi:hypothetical protein
MGRSSKNEIGNVYGRLTVLKEIGRKRGAVLFLCKCECGNEKEITGGDLRSGKVHSCGCYKSEKLTNENKTHGLKNSRIYGIYYGMISRCYNQNATHYENYGGRGIFICKDWLDDFMNFYNWSLANGYRDDLTLDRIDVNGNYQPSNCRWVTMKEQGFNKRNNHYVEIDGEIKTITEWSDIYSINPQTVHCRMERGWDVIYALTSPINEKFINKRYMENEKDIL